MEGASARMRVTECVSADASFGSTPGDADSSNITSSLFSSSSATVDYSYSQNAFGRQEARVVAPDLMKFHKALNNSLLISSNSKRDQSQECQQRRSDSLQKISDCHSPLSLDLNNNVCSPRLGVTKHCSGALTSPVTPNYRQTGDGLNKGWSSERVPLPQNGNRRQVGGAHFSFNNRGQLPSKWEDAERWIFGPATTDTGFKQSVPPTERRQRSKSGPLGASGVFYYSAHSPAVHTFDGIHESNLLAGSHFSAGIVPGHSMQTGYASNSGYPADSDLGITRSASLHGCTPELLNHFSTPYSPKMDEKHDYDVKNVSSGISRAVARRDMATQMSPDGSPCSSSRRKHSVSSTLSMVEMRSSNSPRSDVRDVEVDERVTDTVSRWSRKKKSHRNARGNEDIDNLSSKIGNGMTWDVSETANNISKVRKEEARIAAWENLQKAKAEAAVKKLEMKLEKRRSSSMDKIMNKLRVAQKKGQEMRRDVLANQAQQVSDSSNKTISLRGPTRPMSSLSGCFTCHAFNT